MKRHTVIGLLLAMILLLSGCSDKEGTESIITTSTASVEGVAQKGPFLKGSVVEVYKIRENGTVGDLIKTVSVTDNSGTYKIDLNTSGLVLIKIKGKYFNEVKGKVSDKEVVLENILKIKEGETKTANTNILTHLTAKRTLTLLKNNLSNNLDEVFQEAKKDVAQIFEGVVDVDKNTPFEELDISENEELLKISAAFVDEQNLTYLTNEMNKSNINTTIIKQNVRNEIDNIDDIINNIKNNINKFQKNKAPVIHSLEYNNTNISSGITKNEDFNPFTIKVNASDVDNENLTLDVIADQQIVNIEKNESNMSFTISPVKDKNGDVNITVTVSDGMKVDVKTFTLKVNPVNDAPVIHSLKYNNSEINSSGIIKNEDFTPFTIDVNASDIDNSSLTLDVIANPQIVNIEKNVSNMSFTIYPVQNSSGDVNITVTVSDGELETNQTFTLTINPVNDAPIINSINFNNSPIDSNISVEGSEDIVIDLNISDVDDTNLNIYVNDSAGLTTSAINNTTVTLTPNGSTGETTVTIIVSDGEANTTQSFILKIDYPQLNGKVVYDGYVKNAKIEIFDDNTYTNLIGEGYTDSNGSFTITLNEINLPDPVYIKSTGGVIIDNGMIAPTMLFVGNKNSNGEYIITPITNIIAEKEKSGIDFESVKEQLANDLNLTENALFMDPETNSTIKDVLKEKVLPASIFASTLADGNYTAYIIYFDKDSIDGNITSVDDIEQRIIPVRINISDGNISASFTDDEDENYTIRGYVSGTTVLLELVPDSKEHYVSMAGTVGLYGSVAGVIATFGDSYITPGVFVGQFVPQDINSSQIQKMAADTNRMISGRENLLFRINIGGTGMGIGSIVVNDINQSRSLKLEDINITDEENETVTLIADNNESRFLNINNFPTNLAVMKYQDGNNSVYFIQPIGLRKGIIITTEYNEIDDIGDVYISKSDTITPALKAGTNYTMRVGFVHAGIVGMNRDSIVLFLSKEQNISTPYINISGISDYLREPIIDSRDGVVIFFNDSVMGMYADFDGNDINNTSDYMRTLQIYNSGAFDGENIVGGCPLNVECENIPDTNEYSNSLEDYIGVFVGYFKEQHSNEPSPDGEYNFAARSLYLNDFSDKPTLAKGKLIIENNGNSVMLEIFGDKDSPYTLDNVNCTNGLCHIHGEGSGGDYVDIVWPIGGKKGLYVVSKVESGQVFEIGEAYISH